MFKPSFSFTTIISAPAQRGRGCSGVRRPQPIERRPASRALA